MGSRRRFLGLGQLLVLLPLLVMMVGSASATEIESGYIQVTSTGTVTEDIGFRPDYIEFISAQQIDSLNFEESVPTNSNCPENVNGWSEGSVIFEPSGTSSSDVKKQFSIGVFRNSDSTNDHRVAASTSDVIKNVYSGRNGGKCGELRISVNKPTSNGFEIDVESKYSSYDEIVRYKAYQFPDNMEFDAGMVKVSSEGGKDIDTGFQPANIHVRAGQQISSKNIDTQFEDNDPEEDNTLGRSKGYATLDSDGNVIDQQSIGTASSSDSTNAHRSIASDNYVLNTAYVGQDGNLLDSTEPSRLRAYVTGADSTGFSLQVDDKWSGTDEVFLYRAWGFSYYDFDIGYKVIDTEGTKSFSTGFKPDAIDIYAEQQISDINQEVVTPTNSGCDNAGGWSNGFYETDDDRQWAVGMGRTSASQNSHRQGSTTSYALNNMYSGQDGGDCGDFQGQVTGTSSTGFDMDFSFDSNFDSNYDKEMVYYRAFNFKLAPPQIQKVEFDNSTDEHAFEVNATVKEGSNDIDSCTVTGESDAGNSQSYTGTIKKINDSWSRCLYSRIEYDDHSQWKDRHDSNDELLRLDVTVEVSDVDGLSSKQTEPNVFPNNDPYVEGYDHVNYTMKHAFNASAALVDLDAVNPEELESCSFTFSDDDGNTVSRQGSLDYSYGNSSQAACNYSNINNSMPSLPDPGFEVLEDIAIDVDLDDHHGATASGTDVHEIPNQLPSAGNPLPEDGGESFETPTDLEVTSTDPENDPLTVYFVNASDDTLIGTSGVDASSTAAAEWYGLNVGEEYDWYVKASDSYENFTSPTWEFRRSVSQEFRPVTGIEYRYTHVITSPGDPAYFFFTVRNRIEDEPKTLNTSLSGVEAEFIDGGWYKEYTLPGETRKRFQVRVEPQDTGDYTLDIKTENQELGLSQTESIPVYSRKFQSKSVPEDVPGIGVPQLAVIVIVSTVLFSASL